MAALHQTSIPEPLSLLSGHPQTPTPPLSPIEKLPPTPPADSSTVDRKPTDSVIAGSHYAHSVRHHSSPSTSSISRAPHRSSSGILSSLAAAALDKTQSALANISDPVIRQRNSFARLSLSQSSIPLSDPDSPDKKSLLKKPSTQSLSTKATVDGKQPASAAPARVPISQPYSETDPSRPLPHRSPAPNNTMHQTSSRLLRMTDDERPFTRSLARDESSCGEKSVIELCAPFRSKEPLNSAQFFYIGANEGIRDFKDLFSTLIVSLLPLGAHRVRLTKVDYTFLSEDAISNLNSLKFSQSNRMPDPKDPSRIVTTTTTTTFSMAKDMARSICQRFLEARFIESADGKYQQVYNMKGGIWQLTAKGVTVLDRFCSRNGIQQKQVAELVSRSAAHLVILERSQHTDKLVTDRSTLDVIFRRFAGTEGRNIKSSVTAADSDSLHDYRDGLTGVKMAAERKVNGKTYRETLTGKAASDWLMDCSTIVDRRETIEVATLFVENELLEPVAQDRSFMSQNPGCNLFQPTKYAIYQITQHGKDVINGTSTRGRQSESEGGNPTPRNGINRDSNTQRLDKILTDAALRLLFREYLRDTHCEENLSFYMDVDDFVRSCKAAIRHALKTQPPAGKNQTQGAGQSNASMDSVKEIMAQAYGIYNAFLAPGSPCELNIDHQLRNNLATRMTKAVGQDVTMIETLQEVTELFEDAQNAVFKLMASDSVPKFLRSPKYEQQLRNYEFDNMGRVPERSQSRSNRN